MSEGHFVPRGRKILPLAALAVIAAGCGAAPSTVASSSASPALHLARGSLVQVRTVSVKGKHERVLVNAKGYTLYYFTKDTPKASHCNGGCSALWPAFLTNAHKLPKPAGLKGHLAVVKDSHGHQVSYNGHLLYTYRGDKKPGQTFGQGFLKEWWLATPNLKAPVAHSGGGTGGSGW